jgi:hypothetical protein
MLLVLHLDVVYVAIAIHVCCKCMFQIFQLFQMYVAIVLLHMLQWIYTYVAMYVSNVLAIFKYMLQEFFYTCVPTSCRMQSEGVRIMGGQS